MKNPIARFRNWCFTSYTCPILPIFDDDKMQYMTFQEERCPSTLKHHWQGYVEFKEKISIKAIKEIMKDNKIHLEIRKGTQKQAIDYVHKLDTRVTDKIYEMGSKKQQGARNDLDNIVDAIEDNLTAKEILLQFRGNALRHMGMIQRGLEAFHGLGIIGAMDKTIELWREKEDDSVDTISSCSTDEPTTVNDVSDIKFMRQNATSFSTEKNEPIYEEEKIHPIYEKREIHSITSLENGSQKIIYCVKLKEIYCDPLDTELSARKTPCPEVTKNENSTIIGTKPVELCKSTYGKTFREKVNKLSKLPAMRPISATIHKSAQK